MADERVIPLLSSADEYVELFKLIKAFKYVQENADSLGVGRFVGEGAERRRNIGDVDLANSIAGNYTQIKGSIGDTVANVYTSQPSREELFRAMQNAQKLTGKTDLSTALNSLNENLVRESYLAFKEKQDADVNAKEENLTTAEQSIEASKKANAKIKRQRGWARFGKVATVLATAGLAGGYVLGAFGLAGGFAGLASISTMPFATLAVVGGAILYGIGKTVVNKIWKRLSNAIDKANAVIKGEADVLGSNKNLQQAQTLGKENARALNLARSRINNAISPQNMAAYQLFADGLESIVREGGTEIDLGAAPERIEAVEHGVVEEENAHDAGALNGKRTRRYRILNRGPRTLTNGESKDTSEKPQIEEPKNVKLENENVEKGNEEAALSEEVIDALREQTDRRAGLENAWADHIIENQSKMESDIQDVKNADSLSDAEKKQLIDEISAGKDWESTLEKIWDSKKTNVKERKEVVSEKIKESKDAVNKNDSNVDNKNETGGKAQRGNGKTLDKDGNEGPVRIVSGTLEKGNKTTNATTNQDNLNRANGKGKTEGTSTGRKNGNKENSENNERQDSALIVDSENDSTRRNNEGNQILDGVNLKKYPLSGVRGYSPNLVDGVVSTAKNRMDGKDNSNNIHVNYKPQNDADKNNEKQGGTATVTPVTKKELDAARQELGNEVGEQITMTEAYPKAFDNNARRKADIKAVEELYRQITNTDKKDKIDKEDFEIFAGDLVDALLQVEDVDAQDISQVREYLTGSLRKKQSLPKGMDIEDIIKLIENKGAPIYGFSGIRDNKVKKAEYVKAAKEGRNKESEYDLSGVDLSEFENE